MYKSLTQERNLPFLPVRRQSRRFRQCACRSCTDDNLARCCWYQRRHAVAASRANSTNRTRSWQAVPPKHSVFSAQDFHIGWSLRERALLNTHNTWWQKGSSWNHTILQGWKGCNKFDSHQERYALNTERNCHWVIATRDLSNKVAAEKFLVLINLMTTEKLSATFTYTTTE